MLIVAVVAVIVALAGAPALMVQQSGPYSQTRIGCPFTLEDVSGYRVTQADLIGKSTVI